MKIRYHAALGIVLLVLGALCTVLGSWNFLLGDGSPAPLAGVVCLVMGVLFLARPACWVYSTVVVVPALIGPVKRQFPLQRLETTGTRLYAIRDDGTRKKIPVAKWMANSADWYAVVAQAHHVSR
jgi:hypothetical protein